MAASDIIYATMGNGRPRIHQKEEEVDGRLACREEGDKVVDRLVKSQLGHEELYLTCLAWPASIGRYDK